MVTLFIDRSENWLGLLFGPSPAASCRSPSACTTCPGYPSAPAAAPFCRCCRLCRNDLVADFAQRPVEAGDKPLLNSLQSLSFAKNSSNTLGQALQLSSCRFSCHVLLLSTSKKKQELGTRNFYDSNGKMSRKNPENPHHEEEAVMLTAAPPPLAQLVRLPGGRPLLWSAFSQAVRRRQPSRPSKESRGWG